MKWVSPKQKAQHLKKPRFNKVISDIAKSKFFFMSFVRHPSMKTLEGLHLLLTEIEEFKKTKEYQQMVEQSAKRTEEATELKRKRNNARFNLKRGERESKQGVETALAKHYETGKLTKNCADAEQAYVTRKLDGVAQYIGDRLYRQHR